METSPVVLGLFVLVVVQFPIGAIMYFDAKRLDLKEPKRYWMAMMMPTFSYLFMFYYISERKNLAKDESEE